MCCLPNADRVLARELPKELQRVLKLQIHSSELENMGHTSVSTQTSSQNIRYISSVLERSISVGDSGSVHDQARKQSRKFNEKKLPHNSQKAPLRPSHFLPDANRACFERFVSLVWHVRCQKRRKKVAWY